jgi:ribosome-associated translation inhibitor RaiA
MSLPPNDYISSQSSGTSMTSPLSIDSRRVQVTKGTERQIKRKAAGLGDCFDNITRCEVMVEGPASERFARWAAYGVHIRISLPGEQMVISHESYVELDAAIHEAFDAPGRCLKDYARVLRDLAKVQ